jgi:hypothetical protein
MDAAALYRWTAMSVDASFSRPEDVIDAVRRYLMAEANTYGDTELPELVELANRIGIEGSTEQRTAVTALREFISKHPNVLAAVDPGDSN